MFRRLCLTPVLALAACGGESTEPGPSSRPPTLALDDISILFPLPDNETHRQYLLSPTDQGARGPLLPRNVYDLAPELVQRAGPEVLYQELRVVAARLDPCFPELGRTYLACSPQLRLVMQPVFVQDGEVTTRDSALHLFYGLSHQEFNQVLAALAALRPAQLPLRAPLGVQRTLQAQGLAGEAAQALRDLILSVAGGDNLEQMTFMRVEGLNSSQWVFGGFRREGTFTPMLIPQADTATQTFANIFVFREDDFVATARPDPASADDISPLYNSTLAREAPAEEMLAAAKAAVRVENPRLYHPENRDCVSCHVATSARLWAERNLSFNPDPADRYTFDADLGLTSETQDITGSLRAFGYFGRKVSLSQRTVNETARVLEYLIEEGLASP